MNPVAHDGADAEFAHLPRRVSDDPVVILEDDAKAPIRENFIDQALEGQEILFGHQVQAAVRLTAEALPFLPISTS
jgi:hypothetical protein